MSIDADTLHQPAPGIRRLRAPNPSPMTGSGTNTYLIDTVAGVVVLDPGPDLAAHSEAILACLAGAPVAAILVSHAHLDHAALAGRFSARTGAAVMAFGGAGDGRSQIMRGLAASGLMAGGEGVDAAFVPDRCLSEGEVLRFGDVQIDVLHCPGHMGGHLCFAIGEVLFSGDHVMGWASSLISPPDGDMADYMASLRRLARGQWQQFLPGHGAAVEQPAARLADLIRHRLMREAAVLAAVGAGHGTARDIAALVHQGTPPALHAAAARNVLAHLVDLHSRNKISTSGTPGFESRFTPT